MFVLPVTSGSNITEPLKDALRDGQRSILIPAGNYTCSTVILPDGTTLIGESRHLTHITRHHTPSVFDANDHHGITLRDMTIDIARTANYQTAFSCDNGSGIHVAHCRIYTSNPPADDDTIHAVLCRGTNDILVEGNQLEGCQLKLAGPTKGGGPGIRVMGNYGTNCHNYGLSVVTVGKSICEDVVIIGNVFLNCWAGGIYIGSDGDKDKGGEFRRCIISNNICTTNSPDSGIPITARAGRIAEDWIISGNTCRGVATSTRAAFGILVDKTDTEGNLTHLVVGNNTVTYCEHRGIRVLLKKGSAAIIGNVVSESRGIEFSASSDSSVTVSGNNIHSRSGHPALTLQALASGGIDASVHANILSGGIITEGTIKLTP